MSSVSGASDQLTIGLLWHSVNSDNLGIGALTGGHLAIIDAVAGDLGIAVGYKVIGWRDPAPAYIVRPDVSVVPMRARDILRPGGLYAALRQCDVVLDISAGDSFADIYGARRFALNAASKAVAVLARRPLVLSPQTIGPFERGWARWLASRLMRRARKVVTRDDLSVGFLRPFGLGDKVVAASDVAFRLPYDEPPARGDGVVRVGLNVSGLLFNGGYTGRNMFALACDYPALARALVGHFADIPDCEVHLIGHVNSTTRRWRTTIAWPSASRRNSRAPSWRRALPIRPPPRATSRQWISSAARACTPASRRSRAVFRWCRSPTAENSLDCSAHLGTP
jgi:colanic acid/amylovoran biosynthesis protein